MAYVCTENQARCCASMGQKLWKALGQLSPSSEQSTAVLACGTAPWAQMGHREERVPAAAAGCCAAAAGSSHCVGASWHLLQTLSRAGAVSSETSYGSKEMGITVGSALRRAELWALRSNSKALFYACSNTLLPQDEGSVMFTAYISA